MIYFVEELGENEQNKVEIWSHLRAISNVESRGHAIKYQSFGED